MCHATKKKQSDLNFKDCEQHIYDIIASNLDTFVEHALFVYCDVSLSLRQ